MKLNSGVLFFVWIAMLGELKNIPDVLCPTIVPLHNFLSDDQVMARTILTGGGVNLSHTIYETDHETYNMFNRQVITKEKYILVKTSGCAQRRLIAPHAHK